MKGNGRFSWATGKEQNNLQREKELVCEWVEKDKYHNFRSHQVGSPGLELEAVTLMIV